MEEKERSLNPKPIHKAKEQLRILPDDISVQNIQDADEASKIIAIPIQFSGDL